MSVSQVPPLSSNVPIVYPPGHPSAGCPTPAFATLMQILLDEKAVTDALAEGAIQPGTVTTSGLTAAAQRILGNKEATTGAIEELTLSQALDLIGSAAQGDLLYRGAAGWQRLAAGTSGQYLKTLGTGADPAWASVSSGGGGYEAGPITPPTTTDLATWLNQGTSTATDGTGALILKPQLNSQLHSLVKAAPAAPFDLYARVEPVTRSTSATSAYEFSGGICLRDSADGEIVAFVFDRAQQTSGAVHSLLTLQHWTSNGTTFSSNTGLKYSNSITWKWLRLSVTSTTITAYASVDGKNWIQVTSETISGFIDNVTHYGVCSSGDANATEGYVYYTYFSTAAPS